MGNIVDIIGQRFGRLVVLEFAGLVSRKAMWKCICDCGEEIICMSSNLRGGKTTSCGCKRTESTQAALVTHGMTGTRQHSIWKNMLNRCRNENGKDYPRYGGRGITVCDKWLKFEGFWEDMSEGYSDELTLDRIDNDNGYNKENCRWATDVLQRHNKKKRAGCSSAFIGVSKSREVSGFSSIIRKDHKAYFLGYFSTELEAAIAYDNASEELYGDRPNNTVRESPQSPHLQP